MSARTDELLSALADMGAGGDQQTRALLENAVASLGPRLTDEEAIVLIEVIDEPTLSLHRPRLLDLVETAPGWPLWKCLEVPSSRGVADLRYRLMARGYRPMEMG